MVNARRGSVSVENRLPMTSLHAAIQVQSIAKMRSRQECRERASSNLEPLAAGSHRQVDPPLAAGGHASNRAIISSQMLPEKPLLEQRVAEDTEATNGNEQQPASPQAFHPSRGDIIGDDCCAYERGTCRHPNRVQEVGVKGCPINDVNSQRSKGGRPKRGQDAKENGRAAEPVP